MTSNSIRSFAFGILIAAGVCGLVYFTAPNEANGNKESETKKVVEMASPEEMKKSLEDQGYIIHTTEEWNNVVSNSLEKEDATNARRRKSDLSYNDISFFWNDKH